MKSTHTEKKPPSLPGRAWTEIDLNAIRENARVIKSLAGPDRLYMACVKGDGYGHGMIECARAALQGGADRLSVAWIEDGVLLREAGVHAPIQILIEPRPEAWEAAQDFDLIISLSSTETVRELARRLKRKIKIHIEIDTGMHRVPLQAIDAPAFTDLLFSLGCFEIEGIFSHFVSSTIPDDQHARALTLLQLNAFLKAVAQCASHGLTNPIRHMTNTGALALYPEAWLDMIRPGFVLYGHPLNWFQIPTRSAFSWYAKVDSILKIEAGQGVGYDHTYTPAKNTRIAILSTGYADGYPRALSNLAHVVIHGKRAPLVGLIGMDQMMADVGHIPGVAAGDEATLLGEDSAKGEEVTAIELADHLHTTPAEIICGITARVERRYRYS